MTTAVATAKPAVDPAILERVLIHGDLRQLSPSQKVSYYNAVCESVGLNPLTKPFEYIVLNNKEILYATRAATEQLRQIYAVSVQIMAREVVEDCYVVTARASLLTGRQDESIGAVPILNLRGESRANAMMKAETKAKRRVTLAICGLGMLDETEVESIPHAGYVVTAPAPPPSALPSADAQGERENASAPNAGASGNTQPGDEGKSIDGPDRFPDLDVLPDEATIITKIDVASGGAKGWLHHAKQKLGEDGLGIYQEKLATLAAELAHTQEPVILETQVSRTSNRVYVVGIKRLTTNVTAPVQPVTAGEIPF